MNSRQKGARGEREAAKALKGIGIEATRGVQYQGGKDSPDVRTSLDGVHIEVKRVERVNIHEWMDQAVRDGGENAPVVMHRKNGTEWLLTLRLADAGRVSEAIAAALASVGE